MKWLSQANTDYLRQTAQLDHVDDLNQHAGLNGAIFKRKFLDSQRVHGLGLFGLAAVVWGYYPHMVMHFGQTLTLLGLTAATVSGMLKFGQRDKVNSIEIVREGDHKGKLKVTVSTGPLTSKDLIVALQDCRGVVGLGNIDPLEGDLDPNVLAVVNSLDCSSGQVSSGVQAFVLPEESHKDLQMLDLVMSLKHEPTETDALFNECLVHRYETLALEAKETGGALAGVLAHSGAEHRLQKQAVDAQIEGGSDVVDSNIKAMRDQFGPERLDNMSPKEFYLAYKSFTGGKSF